MTLDPRRLRLLVELEVHGTIRAVAQHEHLSASAVSQQLSVLERETGTALLARSGRRVRLTAAGVILTRRAREILAQMDAAERELRSTGDEPAGTVTLAVFQSAVHSLAVPTAARLMDRHPDLDVVILELEPHQSMPALTRGDVDVIITTTDFTGAAVDPGIDVVPLGEDDVVLVLPAGHPAAAHEGIDLAAFADQRWSMDVEGSYMSELATRLCRQAGFEPRVACRFNNYLITLRHVEAGLSVALLPSLTIDPRFDITTTHLRAPISRRVVAAVRRPRTAAPAITAVLDELRVQSAPLHPTTAPEVASARTGQDGDPGMTCGTPSS